MVLKRALRAFRCTKFHRKMLKSDRRKSMLKLAYFQIFAFSKKKLSPSYLCTLGWMPNCHLVLLVEYLGCVQTLSDSFDLCYSRALLGSPEPLLPWGPHNHTAKTRYFQIRIFHCKAIYIYTPYIYILWPVTASFFSESIWDAYKSSRIPSIHVTAASFPEAQSHCYRRALTITVSKKKSRKNRGKSYVRPA